MTDQTIALDTLAHLLATERRQLVIRALEDQDPIRLTALADELHSDSPHWSSRKDTYTTLQRNHVPKLVEEGIVAYRDDERKITQGPRFEIALEGLDALAGVVDDDQRIVPDGGEEQIDVCPKCDSARIHKNVQSNLHGRPATEAYYYRDCGETFDDAKTRTKQSTGGRSGLAGELADPDTDLMTDGGWIACDLCGTKHQTQADALRCCSDEFDDDDLDDRVAVTAPDAHGSPTVVTDGGHELGTDRTRPLFALTVVGLGTVSWVATLGLAIAGASAGQLGQLQAALVAIGTAVALALPALGLFVGAPASQRPVGGETDV